MIWIPFANSLNPLPAFNADCPIESITPANESKIPLTASPNDVIASDADSNTCDIESPNC